jgi:hypothetical protein
MSTALQLNPPLPMTCPKGEGFAHLLIDYGPESDLYWTIFITETGEVWTYANRHVRASKHITLGRTLAPKAAPAPAVESDDELRERLLGIMAGCGAAAERAAAVQVASGAALDEVAGLYGIRRRTPAPTYFSGPPYGGPR